jgi:hypothetical protein
VLAAAVQVVASHDHRLLGYHPPLGGGGGAQGRLAGQWVISGDQSPPYTAVHKAAGHVEQQMTHWDQGQGVALTSNY